MADALAAESLRTPAVVEGAWTRGIALHAVEAIVAVDDHGVVTFFNRSAERTFRCTSEDAVGGPLERFIPVRLHGAHAGHIKRFKESGQQAVLMSERTNAVAALRADGEEFEAEVSIVRLAPGTPYAYAALLRDISRRRGWERAIRRERDFTAAVVDSVPNLLMVLDHDGRIVRWNRACEAVTGRLREEMIGASPEVCGHESAAHFQIPSGASPDETFRCRIPRHDGAVRLIEWTGTILEQDPGERPHTLWLGADVTDRVRAEERYQRLFDSAGEALFTTRAGMVSAANRAAEAVTGFTQEELQGRSAIDLFAPEEREDVRAAIQMFSEGRDAVVLADLHALQKDGGLLPIEMSLSPIIEDGVRIGLQAIVRDVTEQKKAELERLKIEMKMRETQRLESLGVLAGGVAHDFNNLLTVIRGNAALLGLSAPLDEDAREAIHEIEVACAHAADLAQQILTYAGKSRPAMRRLDVNQLIGETSRLLHGAVSKSVTVDERLSPGVLEVEGDASQLRQVVMNLLMNAAEAVGQASGSISIATGEMDCDRPYLDHALLGPDVTPGRYVFAEVQDSGHGMDEDTLARIFDPFFTTKTMGRGLGLAAVLGIIRAHQGAMVVRSVVGQGTSFRILLPARR